MGKSSPRSLPEPNPADTINAQAEANRVTEFTPFGNRVFGTVGPQGEFIQGTGGAAASVALTPDTQQGIEIEQQVANLLRGRALGQTSNLPEGTLDFSSLPFFASELDFSGLTPLAGAGDFDAATQRTTDAIFERGADLLRPEFANQEEALLQRLANQGIPVGAEAASGSGREGESLGDLTRFERNRNEAFQGLALDAIGAGQAEQSRLFGQSLTARGQGLSELLQQEELARGARNQGINELLTQRDVPFGELSALLGIAPTQVPRFGPPANLDVAGAFQQQQNAQIANQNAEAQRAAARSQAFGQFAGLAGSLGGAAILAP